MGWYGTRWDSLGSCTVLYLGIRWRRLVWYPFWVGQPIEHWRGCLVNAAFLVWLINSCRSRVHIGQDGSEQTVQTMERHGQRKKCPYYPVLLELWVLIYIIAFGKPAGHREVAPWEFDVHSRWKPAREAEEKRRRRRRRRIRIRMEDEDKAVKRKRLACVASGGCNNLLIVYQISTAPSKVAPGTMYEPLAWQQTAAWKETRWKWREIAPREVDVHARWKPERAKQKRRE